MGWPAYLPCYRYGCHVNADSHRHGCYFNCNGDTHANRYSRGNGDAHTDRHSWCIGNAHADRHSCSICNPDRDSEYSRCHTHRHYGHNHWLEYVSEFQIRFFFRFPPGSIVVSASDNGGRVNLPFTAGTNLSSKYVDVQIVEGANPCKRSAGGATSSENVTINGIQFLKELGSEGAPGSIYDWTSYS